MGENSLVDESFHEAEFIETNSSPYVDFTARRLRRNKRTLLFGSLFVVIVLGVAGYFFISHIGNGSDAQKIQGKVAMSEKDLRAIVIAKHLTVYWAGPMAGAKYALIANKPGVAFVRYLSNGNGLNETTTLFRVIATYVVKGAFPTTQSAGALVGNVGFTNVDGNSVFYVKTRPTNVYMGIKNKDIQIEIFDPGVDQALGLSLIHNLVQAIA